MKLFKALLTVTAISVASSITTTVFADEADMTNAEVRKVDKEAKKITLKLKILFRLYMLLKME